jgi:serine/threonine protein kinase
MFAVGDATDQVVLDDLEAPTDLVPAELAAQIISDDSTIRLMNADLPLFGPPPTPRARRAPGGSLPAAPRRLASGTVDGDTPVVTSLGGYTVTGVLASGSMGVVYSGIHPTLHVEVAIKTLRPKLQTNPAVVARFFAEAIATARIAHPHVVRYFDFGYDARGAAFLVTELLDGETLSARLARERRLDVATAVEISLQVGLALAAAHQLGVVHRDLKPRNLLVNSDCRLRVADFGKCTSNTKTTLLSCLTPTLFLLFLHTKKDSQDFMISTTIRRACQ